ncbi:YciI family protein [Algoriphagus limi]|uniref:YciI family protein n=1 Tax=Algoriphagus limi TaxID=2975273 RepID=A0ABT2G955_9BACT|nr:YciI family protein [Algoriphagus limi]MCS5491803.1 YciI family protein [Algoriphagus limi]
MKTIYLSLILFLAGIGGALAQNPDFDQELATKLGADDYGMKKYVIAFLYRGERVNEYSAEERAKLQQGHLANINKLAEEGKMVLAGPFFGNEDLRGLFFFNVESLEEAQKLTESDPSIQAGVLKMELKEWYGSAALPLLLELHSKIQKEDI